MIELTAEEFSNINRRLGYYEGTIKGLLYHLDEQSRGKTIRHLKEEAEKFPLPAGYDDTFLKYFTEETHEN